MGRVRAVLAIALLLWAPCAMAGEAYNYKDAVLDIVPGGRGLPDAIGFIDVIGSPDRTFSADPKDLEFFEFVAKSMQRFNFKEVYESDFLHPMEDGFRGTAFTIVNQQNDFRLQMIPATGNPKPLTGDLGSFATQVALKHNTESPVGGNSYSGFVNSDFLLKQLSEKQLLRLLDNWMHVMDYSNVRILERDHGYDWETATKPFNIIDDFRKAFPAFMAWSDKYATVTGRRSVGFDNHRSYTAFALNMVSKMDRIEEDYPGVADRLEKLRGLARFFIVLKNPQGHVLVTFLVNTEEDFFSLFVVEREGKTVPVDVSGPVQRPVFEEAFYLSELTKYPFTVEVTWASSVAGLDFETKGIRLAGDYESSPEKMLFSLKLTNVDRTKISGRAYNLVPTWVLDLLVPGDFDDVIYDFAQCMVKANDGQGSLFVLDMDKRRPREHQLRLTASSEIIDNFFIRFGLRVLSNKFNRDEDEIADSKRMYEDAMSAVLKDLAAMENPKEGGTAAKAPAEGAKAEEAR